MSKPWKPEPRVGPAPGRAFARRPVGFRGGRGVRKRGGRLRVSAGEWRLVLVGGLFLGLAVAKSGDWLTDPAGADSLSSPPAAPAVPSPSPDHWAESRRSAEILKAQEGAPGPARAPVRAAPASVRVIDGDTFVLAGERIRVVGLDAPETHPPRCAREAELGARATARARQWLAAGPFELTSIERDEDRFGRKLRIVSRQGEDLAETMIAEGLARPYGGGMRRGWCG